MGKIPIKSTAELQRIRESCRIVGEVLALIGSRIRPGVEARELDLLAEVDVQRGLPIGHKGQIIDRFALPLCLFDFVFNISKNFFRPVERSSLDLHSGCFAHLTINAGIGAYFGRNIINS